MEKKLTDVVFVSDGHLSDEGISLYVDGLATEKINQLPAEVLNHVEDCLRCKTSILDLYEIIVERGIDSESVHPTLDQSGVAITFDEKKNITEASLEKDTWNKSLFYKIAAALIITSGLGYISYLSTINNNNIFTNTSDSTNVISKDFVVVPDSQLSDSIKQAPGEETNTPPMIAKEDSLNTNDYLIDYDRLNNPEELFNTIKERYAANFTPAIDLEGQIDDNTRSGSIRVISPENEALLRDSIHFRWEGSGSEVLTIQILDNFEEEAHVATVSGDSYILTEKLSKPGLYYWKIETDNDLLYVGKFYYLK